MTELAARMALHTPGQITWPEPDLKKTCDQCQHFAPPPDGARGEGEGVCDLVRAHQHVTGRAFYGAKATACPQFRG